MSIFKKAQPENPASDAAAKSVTVPGVNKKGKNVDKRNSSLKRLSITSTILFLIFVLAFNIIFDNLLGKLAKWDWSATQQYTIGDVSQVILDNLDKDIQIIGLFDEATDTSYKDVQLLLEDYAKKSSGKLTIRYVDPDKTPSILTDVDPEDYLGLTSDMFVVYCAATNKAKAVTNTDIFQYEFDQTTYQQYLTGITAEESFSGAIKYVQSETTPVLYFTRDHDELDYGTQYSLLVSTMQNNNYDVKPLATFTLTAIPEDCAVLIMAEPEKDITPSESNVIGTYLKSGGSLMVIAGFGNSEFPVLNKLLADYNLEISHDKIREGDVNYQYNNSDAYSMRAIAPAGIINTEDVDGFTLMENVRGMNILNNAKSWITNEAVLTTSVKGVAETDGDVNKSSQPGTQNVAVICENNGYIDNSTVTESAKVMLIGSSAMFSDTMLNSYGNQIYNFGVFYYGINWMSNLDASNDLMIDAKQPVSYALTAGSQGTFNFSAILTFIILPILMLVAALVVYRKRKHL